MHSAIKTNHSKTHSKSVKNVLHIRFNKRISNYLFITALAFSLFGCSIEIKDVALPQGFIANASEYSVAGKNSVFDDKQLNFGPYRTTAVRRGDVTSNSSDVLVRNKYASQDIRFSLTDGDTLRAKAKAIGRIAEKDASVLARWLRNKWWFVGDRVVRENYFAGSISIEGHPDGIQDYEFMIPNAYNSFGRIEPTMNGTLLPINGTENDRLIIQTYRKDDEGLTFLQNSEAYILTKDETIISAVQTNHPEKIWINSTVSPLQQFVAANLMGLLMLRQELPIE